MVVKRAKKQKEQKKQKKQKNKKKQKKQKEQKDKQQAKLTIKYELNNYILLRRLHPRFEFKLFVFAIMMLR